MERSGGSILKWGAVTVVALAAIAVAVGAVYTITTQQRWNDQRIESAAVLEVFCQYNLAVSDTACQNWAYQTVNSVPSTTDGILRCDRVYWSGTSARNQESFVSCLARSGVYIPQ